MHRSDFQFAHYSNAHTYNPSVGYLLSITQDRVYRFKQIWAFVNSDSFGTSGVLTSNLKFWQGALTPTLANATSGIQTAQSSLLPLDNVGILVASFPCGRALATTAAETLAWGLHTTSHWTQTKENCFSYATSRSTGYLIVPKTLDVEVICDFITLDIAWNTNQYAPYPAMIACIGSTHPPAQYPEYNFVSL